MQAVGANGEIPGTDDLDAGAKRVNPEVTKISQALDDKAEAFGRVWRKGSLESWGGGGAVLQVLEEVLLVRMVR